MAYDIIGNVYKIGTTENIQTKSGSIIQRRQLTLMQKRFDQNTGQEYDPNFPALEFTGDRCAELDKYSPGDRVHVRFDISGMRYNDRNTGEEKFFCSLRAFRIEGYNPQQGQVQQYPQNPPYPQPQNWQQTPQYPPQQGQGQQGSGNKLPF